MRPLVQYNFFAILHLSGLVKMKLPRLNLAFIKSPGFTGSRESQGDELLLKSNFINEQKLSYPQRYGIVFLYRIFIIEDLIIYM
tara:strand:+ start:119 stop:370 length:252 start_codon:yes stop_codon:yes gene_type:complete